MFLSVYRDICKFLQKHFLASLIITVAYYAFARILIEGAFDNSDPLFGYKFFFYENFVANILFYSVILSATFLVVLYFERHRKVTTDSFFSEMKEHLPKFVFGGLFLSVVIGCIFYISFLFGQMNIGHNYDFLAVIRVVILIFAIIVMLKSVILFFPILYHEENKSLVSVFRFAIKRSSWRLIAYYLLFIILIHWLGLMLYYIFDIVSLFKIMGVGIEDLIQAYMHVIIMLVQISIYKNVTKFE